MSRVWCFYPWFEMNYAYFRGAAPCCMFCPGEPMDRPVEEEWNSEYFKDIRRRLVSGDVADTACANCRLRIVEDLRHPPFPWASDSEIFRRAEQAYENGEIELDYPPPSLYYGVTEKCNLDCIMCYQRTMEGAKGDPLPDLIVEDYFASELWRRTSLLQLVGGEPFMEPTSVSMIRRLAEIAETQNLDHLRLHITTNGTLLHKWIDTLSVFPAVSFAVSLDSTHPATYEYIRKGAKWEQTRDNLLALKEAGRGKDWTVDLSFLVMKSTIPYLAESACWSGEYGARKAHFRMVCGEGLIHENVFDYPYLLEDLPEWEAHLDEAAKEAENYGLDESVSQLAILKRLLNLSPRLDRAMVDELVAQPHFTQFAVENIFYDKVRVLNGLPPITAETAFVQERFPESYESESRSGNSANLDTNGCETHG